VFIAFVNIKLKEDVVSLTDFARNTKRHAEELACGGRPRILTQNGKASVVVLSLNTFEELSRDAEDYRMDQRLRHALDHHAAGDHGSEMATVMNQIRQSNQARRKGSS